jgi:hypothetical protein
MPSAPQREGLVKVEARVQAGRVVARAEVAAATPRAHGSRESEP